MSKHSKDVLRILPLGGLGEVGKNMMAYEYDGRILVVDAGLMFPDNDMLGVDYIIPDFHYLRNNADKVDGIVITHGHEDHIGAIQHLLSACPCAGVRNSPDPRFDRGQAGQERPRQPGFSYQDPGW